MENTSIFTQVERDGRSLLGIKTGIKANSFVLRKLTGDRSVVGYLVGDEGFDTWKPEGFIEEDGQVTLLGPVVGGRSLEDVLASEDALERIVDLSLALKHLFGATGGSYDRLHANMVLFADDGRILFLPRSLLEVFTDHQSLEDQLSLYEPLNHPDRKGEENLAFAVAVLLYRVTAGALPYEAEEAEELHSRMRNSRPVPLLLRKPEVNPALSDLVGSCLDPGAGPGLAETATRLREIRDQGFFRAVGDEERARLAERAEAFARRHDQTYRRREAVRKNWRRSVIIGALIVVVGSIPATILVNSLQPRRTTGLSAPEVAEVYYGAMNALDHDLMEDATIEDAGRAEINEAMNLFVLSRMRLSVEGRTGIADPSNWLAEGRPELPATVHLYGVSNLEIEVEIAGSEDQVMRARYLKWVPDAPDDPETLDADPNPQARSLVFRREDRLFLRLQGDAWVIYRLDRVQDELLGYASDYDPEA